MPSSGEEEEAAATERRDAIYNFMTDDSTEIDDTASTISVRQLRTPNRYRNRMLKLDSRERALNNREVSLNARDVGSALSSAKVAAENLKKKVDRFLEDEFPQDLLVDPDIYGYTYSSHPYLYMSVQDQTRLTRLRSKIIDIRQRIEERKHQNFVAQRPAGNNTIPICPICFDDLRATENRIESLACGHMYCEPCLRQLSQMTTSTRRKCAYCNEDLRYEQRRVAVLICQ